MAFNESFTGKGVTQPIQSTGELGRSQENMNNLILSSEKLKFDTFQRNQEEFLKAANIDPVFVLANSARDVQSKMLDEFNNKWGKTMKSRGGNLTTDDKMQMMKEKDFIIMQQQKMQSDMAQMQLHQKMVAQNPSRWDAEELSQWVNDYMKTGTYEHPEPPIRPLSLTDAAMKMMNKVATKEYIPREDYQTYTVGGVPYMKYTAYSAKKEDVVPYIQSAISSNDQYAAGALKEWNSLTPQEKETYHNANPKNPILEMAVDRHWKEWVTSKEREEKNTMPARGGGLVIDLFGKHYTNFAPGVQLQGTRNISDKNFDNPIEFNGTLKLSNVYTTGGIKLGGRTSRDITTKGNIEGYLKAYDPVSDKLILVATGTDPDIDSGTHLEIPAKNVNEAELNKIPVVVNGKQTTLGAIRGTISAPTVSTTAKKKYNPKTGQFE
jgi:hypothetical protein